MASTRRMLLGGAAAGLPIAATLLWLLAVAVPGLVVLAAWMKMGLVVGEGVDGGAGASAAVAASVVRSAAPLRDGWWLLLQGMAWASAIGASAAALGWWPGRVLRGAGRRGDERFGAGRALLAVALVAPVALPSYLVSWCWWQMVPPGSTVGDWAVRHDLVQALRAACLAGGLLAWTWPLVALAVAVLGRDGDHQEAMVLDGSTRWARLSAAWFEDRRALVAGGVASALLVFGNTTAFDLAQVRSWGFELRTLDARGAGAGELLRAATPALAVAIVGGAVLWGLARPDRGLAACRHPARARMGVWPGLLIVLSIGVPVVAMVTRLNLPSATPEFMQLYSRALVATVLAALAVGALAAVVAAGLVLRVSSASPWSRRLGAVEGIGWCMATLAPATAIAAALVAAYNRRPTAALYDSPAVALLGQLALVGAVSAVVARLAWTSLPAERMEAIRLEGGRSPLRVLRGASPTIVAAAVTAFGMAFALSLGEVVIGARLMPASIPVLATSILNAVHYQDPETVMLATLMQVSAAVMVAATVGLAWRRAAGPHGGGPTERGRRAPGTPGPMVAVLGLAMLLGLGGCQPSLEPGAAGAGCGPLPATGHFGNRGDAPGTFDHPRAIAADPRTGRVFVIDRTARVQRFDVSGGSGGSGGSVRFELEWTMPEFSLGKPTGVTVGPDGTVWVADTHCHRVMAFDPEGKELLRFGRYGTGPGEFIYPTDVAVAPDGDLYVAEYGGNDRVQVFSPTGEFRFAFGSFGEGEGEFRRPQAILFDRSGSELWIADSCNHRIVVVDRSGRWLRAFGQPGTAVGDLAYPYGMDRLPDGSVLVVEFGNQRIQRLSEEGRVLDCWGGAGEGLGQLRTPWGVAVGSSTIFVLDSGNSRVQIMPIPLGPIPPGST